MENGAQFHARPCKSDTALPARETCDCHRQSSMSDFTYNTEDKGRQ